MRGWKTVGWDLHANPPIDVGNAVSVDEALSAAADQGQVPTGVVCAGILSTGDIGVVSEDDWKETLRVNFFGVVNVLRAVHRWWGVMEQSGVAVVVSSMAAERGLVESVAYCASKAALLRTGAERDDVLRDIRKETIKLLLADDATKPLVSSGFIDEVLQVATARERAAA